MITDWLELAEQIQNTPAAQSGGTTTAQIALEQILGQQWVESSVDHIVELRTGWNLAMNCLRHIHSEQAVLYAYEVYKNSQGDRAAQAVWLIKHIAHPISFDWVKEFLQDENVMAWGIGVLDQLIWTERIPYDRKAKVLMVLAEKTGYPGMVSQVEFIREYTADRKKVSR